MPTCQHKHIDLAAPKCPNCKGALKPLASRDCKAFHGEDILTCTACDTTCSAKKLFLEQKGMNVREVIKVYRGSPTISEERCAKTKGPIYICKKCSLNDQNDSILISRHDLVCHAIRHVGQGEKLSGGVVDLLVALSTSREVRVEKMSSKTSSVCVNCKINGESLYLENDNDVVMHLLEHRSARHFVPKYLIDKYLIRRK